MANKASRREKSRAQRRARKKQRMSKAGSQSNYALKSDYLHTVNRRAEKAEGAANGARVWGFDFAKNDKPWKGGAR